MQRKISFKMLKVNALAFFISIMSIAILNVIPAKAATDYKVMDPKYSLEPNHEFKVKLSQDVDETNLKEGDIKIYEKGTLKPVDITLKKDPKDPRNVMVKGSSPFINGKTYTIEVINLKSKTNMNLKNPAKMDFTIKNIYSGLPAEEGLIIVDNKAYAIDYLTKNIKMVNEILSKSYDIYYTYDSNYEKIYSLFKPGPVNGSNLTRKYDEMIRFEIFSTKFDFES